MITYTQSKEQNNPTFTFASSLKHLLKAFLMLILVGISLTTQAQGYIDCSTVVNVTGNSNISNHTVKNGYTYVYFRTSDQNLPVINGNPHLFFNNAYLAIFDPNCTQIYGSYFVGQNPYVDIDDNNNIFLTFPTDYNQITTDGSSYTGMYEDIYIAKLSPTGDIIWATFSNGDDNIESKEILTSGTDVFVFGNTYATDFVTTDGTIQQGYQAVFYSKYDAGGILTFSTLISGDYDTYFSHAVEVNGGAVVGGWTLGGNFFTTDGSTNDENDYDPYVRYYDASGNLVFSTLIDANDDNYIADMAFDGTHIYVLIDDESTNFPTTDGTTNSGGLDMALIKYDLSGNIVYSTLIGGSDDDYAKDIKIQNGKIYISGNTKSPDFPVVNGMPHTGGTDFLLMSLDSNDGSIIYSTLYGSTDDDADYGFAVTWSNNNAEADISVTATGEVYTAFQVRGEAQTTDGTTGSYGTIFAKFNADGSLCASSFIPVSGKFVDASHSGDTITIGVQQIPGGSSYTTDGTLTDAYFSTEIDFGTARFVFCPTPAPITSDVLTPSTINACQDGVLDQIIGEELVIPGSSFPDIYRNGAIGNQPDLEYDYQWQSSLSTSGPWMDIPGTLAQQKNYSPEPLSSDMHYRRQTKASECCGGGAVLSTSSITSVLISANMAPVINAGGTYYTCPGNPVSLEATPTEGTPPYTYNWEDGLSTLEDPIVTPTESTVYTVEIMDANDCMQLDQAIVVTYVADAGMDTDVCDGVSTTLGGSPLSGLPFVAAGDTPPAGVFSMSYAWMPTTALSCSDCPNPSATPSSATNYILTVTIYSPDGSSCSTTDDVDVNAHTAPSTSLTVADRVICLGEMFELGTNPAPINAPAISAVSQSSADGGSATIANLSDGDFSTGGHTNDGSTENITIDLGSLQTINQVQIATLAGQTFDDGMYLELSTDNSTFTQIGGYRYQISSTQKELITFPEQSVRYVRLRAAFSSRDVSISELTAAYDYTYIWTPGTYITTSGPSAMFDAGNLEMPETNPITYTVSATLGECTYYEQVSVAITEARAHDGPEYGCGPKIIGEPDRTPNLDETFSWRIIPGLTTGDSDFLGASNELQIPVSATTSGQTAYELTTSYTFNGSTQMCYDTAYIVPCGCSMDYKTVSGGCPDFDLGGTGITVTANLGMDGQEHPYDFSWSPQMGLSNYNSANVELTDNISRTYTVTATSQIDPNYSCSFDLDANSPAFSRPVINAMGGAACSGDTINIGDPANNPGLTYSWSGGTSSLESTSINYPRAFPLAETEYILTATDIATRCEAVDTVTVAVPERADAGADAVVCDNGVITIGNNMDTIGVTYSWAPVGADWQNGTGPTDAQPDVLVSIDQQFILTATDTSNICVSIDTVNVTIEPLPPSFTLSNLGFCPSQTSALVLGTSDGTSAGANEIPDGFIYSWTPAVFLDDATLRNPTVNAPLPSSSFTFKVVASTPGGCSQISTQTITPVVSAPLVANNKSICLGESVSIGDDANSTGGNLSYLWSSSPDVNGELSTVTGINPVFTPSAAGLYTFTLTLSDNTLSCSATASVTIDVKDITAPSLSPVSICEGETTTIGQSDNEGLQWVWTPATGLSDPDISNPVFSGTETTNYTVTFISPSGCFAEGNTSVTVTPAPIIDISLPDTTICDASVSSIILNPVVSPTGNYAYIWTPTTNLSSSNVLNPEFFVPAAGDYEYALELIDQGTGCSLFDTTIVSVHYVTLPDLVTRDSSVCEGGSIDLSLLVIDNNNTSGTTTFHTALPTTSSNQLASSTVTPMDMTTYYVYKGEETCNDIDSLTISLAPVEFTATTTDVTCGAATDNGTITVTNFAASSRYDMSTGSSYTGTATFATATAIPATGIITNTLPNPSTSQDYTVRLFNSIGCTKDTTVTINVAVCSYDWGDLPDTGAGTSTGNYETDMANNGPSHLIIPDLYLGRAVDEEPNGQQSIDALGDGADEDGTDFSSSSNFTPGSTVTLPLTVNNATGATAYLEAWIDWNGDGDFDDANEMILDIDDGTGVFPTTYQVVVPADAVIGQNIGARYRLSQMDNMTPYGTINSGEVEDYLIQVNGIDYSTSLFDCVTPACHVTSTDIYIGAGVSNESAPSATEDEDGLNLGTNFNIQPGATVNFPLTIYNNTGNTAYLTAWIDWNGDGDYDDTGEQFANTSYDAASYNGSFVVLLPANVPASVVTTAPINLRFRVSTDETAVSSACGTTTCAADGEVEDYLIQIQCKSVICSPVQLTIKSRNP